MTVEELILRRRRQVLVHSIIYYKMNTNIVSDAVFDGWARELAELQRRHPDASESVEYHRNGFYGFTGETGFDLPLYDRLANRVAGNLVRDALATGPLGTPLRHEKKPLGYPTHCEWW